MNIKIVMRLLALAVVPLCGCVTVAGERGDSTTVTVDAKGNDYHAQVVLDTDLEGLKVGPDLNIVKLYVPNDSGKGAMSAGVEHLKQHSMIPEHIHKHMEELIYVIEGDGIAVVGGQKHKVAGGDLVLATPGTAHGFINTGNSDLKLFVVYNKNDMMGFFRDYSFENLEDVKKRFNQEFMSGLLRKYGEVFTVPRTVVPPTVTQSNGSIK